MNPYRTSAKLPERPRRNRSWVARKWTRLCRRFIVWLLRKRTAHAFYEATTLVVNKQLTEKELEAVLLHERLHAMLADQED